MVDEGDLILRAVVEGPAGSRFTRMRAQMIHSEEAPDVHVFLKKFFYGGCECPWCGMVVGSDSV